MAYRPLVKRTAESRAKRQKGGALIEFMLTSLVWVPLLLGTIVFGINLVKGIQSSQLARDSGHMYAYGIDFTQTQNTPLLTKLAASLKITQTGGNGAVILSKITLVTDTDCAAANMKVCANDGKYVFTSIYIFGNPSYSKTQLGNPSSWYLSAGPSITASQYLSDKSLVATNIPDLFGDHTQSGQYAYVSEVMLNSQALSWSSFSNTGSYVRAIF